MHAVLYFEKTPVITWCHSVLWYMWGGSVAHHMAKPTTNDTFQNAFYTNRQSIPGVFPDDKIWYILKGPFKALGLRPQVL